MSPSPLSENPMYATVLFGNKVKLSKLRFGEVWSQNKITKNLFLFGIWKNLGNTTSKRYEIRSSETPIWVQLENLRFAWVQTSVSFNLKQILSLRNSIAELGLRGRGIGQPCLLTPKCKIRKEEREKKREPLASLSFIL